MSFPISDALAIIQNTLLLLKEEPAILASPEDAAYFRMLQTKAASKTPSKPQLPKKELSRPQEDLLNLDSEKQGKNPHLESPSQIEKSETQDRFSKAAASRNSDNLIKSDIAAASQPPSLPSSPTSLKLENAPSSVQLSESLPVKEENLPKTVMAPAVLKSDAPIALPRDPSVRPYSQFRSILEKIAPELAILDTIPDDATAKQIATRWKTKNQSAPISILSSGELPQHKALLSEIATALDVYFGPARLIEADSIEKEKQWKTFLSVGNLKMIVICDSTLWQLHHLRQYYKETPATGIRMLGDVPIFLLPDLSLYLKDPLLKRSLWKALCSKLS